MAKEDWKELLPEDDKKVLAQILNSINKYRCAFMQADDVKIAQLWTALIELKKEMNRLEQITEKLTEPFRAIVEIGEVEKRKAIENIINNIIKPDPEQEEATKNLVNSLMKF